MRDFRLFAIRDDEHDSELEVAAIHDDTGYKHLRESLSKQYDLGQREPNIQVWNVDLRGDRMLTLRHHEYHRRPLGSTTDEVIKHIARLWGFAVKLEVMTDDGTVEVTHEVKKEKRKH